MSLKVGGGGKCSNPRGLVFQLLSTNTIYKPFPTRAAGLLGTAEELAANLALGGLAQLDKAAVGAEVHDLAGLQAGDVLVGVAAGELLQAGDAHPDALARA